MLWFIRRPEGIVKCVFSTSEVLSFEVLENTPPDDVPTVDELKEASIDQLHAMTRQLGIRMSFGGRRPDKDRVCQHINRTWGQIRARGVEIPELMDTNVRTGKEKLLIIQNGDIYYPMLIYPAMVMEWAGLRNRMPEELTRAMADTLTIPEVRSLVNHFGGDGSVKTKRALVDALLGSFPRPAIYNVPLDADDSEESDAEPATWVTVFGEDRVVTDIFELPIDDGDTILNLKEKIADIKGFDVAKLHLWQFSTYAVGDTVPKDIGEELPDNNLACETNIHEGLQIHLMIEGAMANKENTGNDNSDDDAYYIEHSTEVASFYGMLVRQPISTAPTRWHP